MKNNTVLNANLGKAFRELRKKGYFARQNFLCCRTCGWAAIPKEQLSKAVFYHGQDNDDKLDGKDFYLAWDGDGKEICDILKSCGVDTDWNGDQDERIKVINK